MAARQFKQILQGLHYLHSLGNRLIIIIMIDIAVDVDEKNEIIFKVLH